MAARHRQSVTIVHHHPTSLLLSLTYTTAPLYFPPSHPVISLSLLPTGHRLSPPPPCTPTSRAVPCTTAMDADMDLPPPLPNERRLSLSLSPLLFSSLLLLLPHTPPPFFLAHTPSLSTAPPHILATPRPLPYAAAVAAFGQPYLFHELPLDSISHLSLPFGKPPPPPFSSLLIRFDQFSLNY